MKEKFMRGVCTVLGMVVLILIIGALYAFGRIMLLILGIENRGIEIHFLAVLIAIMAIIISLFVAALAIFCVYAIYEVAHEIGETIYDKIQSENKNQDGGRE